MNRLIIIGASGHGKVVADVAKACGYKEIAFLDDNKELATCGKYDVIGTVADFSEFVGNSTDYFVAIGSVGIRQQILNRIENAGGTVVTLIYPDAVVAEDVEIGTGTVVMAGTVINSGTAIGKGVIINTSSSIDHDCEISDYCHIAVGAHLCGSVAVGECTWVGAGVTVSNNVNICGGCMIGAGAVVVKDIKEEGTYIGVPAQIMKQKIYVGGGNYSFRINMLSWRPGCVDNFTQQRRRAV